MNKAERHLPQLNPELFLIGGGIEATLIFHEGFDLPHFAAFELLNEPKGRQALIDYYERYLNVAREEQLGFILETQTWSTSKDWGQKIGCTDDDIKTVNETRSLNFVGYKLISIKGVIKRERKNNTKRY